MNEIIIRLDLELEIYAAFATLNRYHKQEPNDTKVLQ